MIPRPDPQAAVLGQRSPAQQGLADYLTFDPPRRPHSALDRKTPDEFYDEHLPNRPHAAAEPRGGPPLGVPKGVCPLRGDSTRGLAPL